MLSLLLEKEKKNSRLSARTYRIFITELTLSPYCRDKNITGIFQMVGRQPVVIKIGKIQSSAAFMIRNNNKRNAYVI